MGSSKPKPMQTPFAQTNTFSPVSIAGTQEARDFLDVPIDVDPGVNQRTDNARAEVEDRYNNAFNMGTPSLVRDLVRSKELREVNERGARESQAANVEKNRLEVGRRERLLPQVYGTGTSGYGTQIVQPQPGFWQRLALGAVGGGSQAAQAYYGGGG